MVRHVVQGLYFYPRGGSAQVVRYLSAALTHHNVNCTILSGSVGEPGERSHAPTFFREVPVVPVDYGPALDAARRGDDPFLEPVPLHPSYEDRSDVPDRIFTSAGPETADHLESAWTRLLRERIDPVPDVLHLHHLTPMQAAVRANWPDVPMIGHLHGTELGMLTGLRARSEIARKLGLTVEHDASDIALAVAESGEMLTAAEHRIADSTRWEYWRYATVWEQRLLRYARLCDRLVVLSDEARDQAAETLGFDRTLIHPMPNGFDATRFRPEQLDVGERRERWRRWLVEDPQGWDESGQAGSVRYSDADLDEWFGDGSDELPPILLFVGRFVHMKRVPLLIRAYKRAQERFNRRAPLLIWGGSPGEWEGEHPVTVARREQVPGIFFVGWRGHSELPDGLNAADVMVAPSTNEPFGQVYIEAMACALPVIGTRSGGPLSFVNTRDDEPNGWLVPPDDEGALADALVEVVNNPDERRKRGENALHQVQEKYSWDRIAGDYLSIYDQVIDQVRQRSAFPADRGGVEGRCPTSPSGGQG